MVTSVSARMTEPRVNPPTVGLNVTFMTQVPPAAITKLFVQVVVAVAIENGAVTVRAGLPREMDTPVLLVTVILMAALATPTAVVGNVIVPGLSEKLMVPVPVKPMSCGEEGWLSL